MNLKNENADILDFKQDENDMSSTKFRNIDEVDHANDEDEEIENEINIIIHCKMKHSSCICRNIEFSLLK
jgi:hypothetical protein